MQWLGADAGPPATTTELQAVSACAKGKLIGAYTRHKMQPAPRGTEPLRRADITNAEMACVNATSPEDVAVLIEQAHALGVPGLAPVTQYPQPAQATSTTPPAPMPH